MPTLRGRSALRFAALALVWGLPVSTTAQDPGNPDPVSLSELSYSLAHWSVDDGLHYDHVTAIAQSSDGYLWVGTFRGLARFNGSEFKNFTLADTPELQSERVLELFGDSRGRVWITTLAPGITLYHEGKFSKLPPGDDIPQGRFQAFAEDSTGAIHAFVSHGGERRLLKLDRGAFVAAELDVPDSDRAARLVAGPSPGFYWLLTGSGDLYQITPDGTQPADLDASPPKVFDLFLDSRGLLAASTRQGIFTLDSGRWRLDKPFAGPLPPGARILSSLAGDDDLVWFQEDLGNSLLVARLDGKVSRPVSHSLQTGSRA